MSNAHMLSAVTAVLKEVLGRNFVARETGGSITVSALPPDRVTSGANEQPQLNVFLYQVTHDDHRRQLPHGERGGANEPALELHYLFSAHGPKEFDAEILLGSAIDILNQNAVLTRDAIEQTLAGSPGAREWAPQFDQIQIIPANLSIDVLTSLWTAFRIPYRTSVAYQVRVRR
jgi:hypothetical protein